MSSKYREEGFYLMDLGIQDEVAELRDEFRQVFDTVSRVNGGPAVNNDTDIVNLYNSEYRDLWVAAYDQLGQLLGTYTLVTKPIVKQIMDICGLGMLAYTSKIATRVDMPLGEGSTPTPAHQDYPSHQGSGNSVTLWIPLQDVDSEDGALQAFPASHLDGVIPQESGVNEFNVAPGSLAKAGGLTGHMDSSKHMDDQAVEIPMKAGQILVFSTLLLHRSGVNTGNRIRYSLNIRYNDLTATDYAERKYYLNETAAFRTSEVNFDPRFPVGAGDRK